MSRFWRTCLVVTNLNTCLWSQVLLKSLVLFSLPLLSSRRGMTRITVEWSILGGGRQDNCVHGIWSGYTCCFGCWPLTTPLFSFLSNGTSMISLIIPPKDQISRVAKMLADEFGTASNIKSRVNRLSVLGAITSVQQRLKLYNKGNF